MRHRGLRIFFAVGLSAAALTGTALATNRALFFKFEVAATYAWEQPRLGSTYLHSYSPPFSPNAYQSTASQTLAFDGKKGNGYASGIRFFPLSRLGVEVLYDTFKANMTGVNSAYQTYLKYTARVPPDYVPVQHTYENQDPWPETDGEFKETILSLNAVARVPLGSRLLIKVSGGASFCAFEAQSTSIAFTKFWLGGHSVLFKQEYKLGLDWGKVKATGFNVGGEVHVDLFSNTGLALDVRYFSFREAEAGWQVMTGEGVSETPEDLARLMSLGPVKLDPSLFRFGVGLRFLF